MNPSMAVKKRTVAKREISMDNVEILKSSARGEQYLPTLEALYIVQKNKQLSTQKTRVWKSKKDLRRTCVIIGII